WTLNHGVRQADGRALTHPNLIRPGWVLRLPPEPATPAPPPAGPATAGTPRSAPPVATTPPAPPAPTIPTPAIAPPATPVPGAARGGPPATSGPTTVPTSPGAPSATAPPPRAPMPPTAPTPAPGVQFPSGGYLGLGTVALLITALFSLRLWHRRHYVPGSGQRDDLDEAPVIGELAVAYDAATAVLDDEGDPLVVRPPGDSHVAGRRHAQSTAAQTAPPPGTHVVGTTPDGRPLALDLAAARGLGLIGPGADAAIRALLLALLAERHRPEAAPVNVLIPAADAARMLGEQAATRPPQRLHVVADLDMLLDRLDAEVVTRARLAAGDAGADRATLVVVATPTPALDRRLQAVLDNGSPLGLVGILYGQWRPGATARVRADGVVGAASPDIAATLRGSRLFILPPADAAELLDLLADADAPADNQEAYRRANPTQGPPPPPPDSAPPPDSTGDDEPSGTDGGGRNARREPPTPEPAPTGGGLPAVMPRTGAALSAPSPSPSAAGVAAIGGPPPAASTPLILTVLGSLRLRYRPTPDSDYQLVEGMGPKAREMLAYLALHPAGMSRDAIVAAIWPDAGDTRRRLDNRFYAALSRLRRAVHTVTAGAVPDIVEQDDGDYRLRRDLVTVDLWEVQDALDQRRRAATEADRFAAIVPIAATYAGHLSDDLAGAWAEPYRENLRRQVADALASLTASIGEDTPQRLELLETLRRLDPYNEQLYAQIARAQARLGHQDAIGHTYALLVACLDDIDQQPSPDVVAVFRALRQPDPRDVRSA
ncbi:MULTISPECIES: AfsR/SARP family transcriptional regulator, partial [unclassified Frankia]|uniref:AfsR/SARP family transcriptional regulator n=1 Tax=unclassified Frankia TaxID=2632575 RepID=UPI002AD4B880